MTLKKAIKKYCVRNFNVKWHIDHTKKIFSDENQKIPLEYFENSEKKLREVQKKAKDGLEYYEKLERILQKNKITDVQLYKILKKIRKLNNYMEHDYMAETVMDSLLGIESALRPNIYKEQENQKQELLDVAEQGKVMLYGIAVGAEEIVEIAQKTIIPYAKKHKTEEVYKRKEE